MTRTDGPAAHGPSRHLVPVLAGGLVLAALCGVAIWAAHYGIGAVYRGEILPGLLENRAEKPLEYYLQTVDRIVIVAFFLFGIIAATLYSLRIRSVPLVLGLLLVGDIVLCAAGIAFGGFLAISLDRGVPEWFQYFKEGGTAWLLFRLSRATGRSVFSGLGVLYAFLLLDDSMKYHELGGQLLGPLAPVSWVASIINVRPVDIGEMLSMAPIGLATIVLLAIPYLRESPEIKRIIRMFGLLLAALVMVGGVLDIADRIALSFGHDLLEGVLALFEDGGEMVVMSATFAYALSVTWTIRDGRRYGDKGMR